MTERVREAVVYWVDADDVVVDVGGAWDDFARDNDGDAVLRERVLGKPLWSFIEGDATRMLLSTLLAAVRTHHETLVRRYRCDSSTHRRHMEMRLSPEGDRVRLEHRILEEERMRPGVRFRFARGPNARVRCSMCNRVKLDGAWHEASDAASRGDLPREAVVVYGVCRDCRSDVGRLSA